MLNQEDKAAADQRRLARESRGASARTHVRVHPPAWVQLTRAGLGTLVHKPELSVEALMRPSFEFVVEVVRAVARQTGFPAELLPGRPTCRLYWQQTPQSSHVVGNSLSSHSRLCPLQFVPPSHHAFVVVLHLKFLPRCCFCVRLHDGGGGIQFNCRTTHAH